MAATGRTVLFASTETFESGNQLAAALRRRGVRGELFRPVARGAQRALLRASRLVYRDVHETLGEQDELPHLAALVQRLADPDVVALQATDEILEPLVGELASHPDLLAKVIRAAEPQGLVDKRAQAEVARAAGLDVPRIWADPAGVDDYPVLVKPLLGGGGAGITVAADAAELVQAWHDGAGDAGFVQQLVQGATMHVGGVSSAGEPVVIAAYEGRDGAATGFGQIARSRLRPDSAAVDAATALLRELRYTGTFCFDFVDDGQGRRWFLEVNPRIFGSWMGLQLAGIDVVGAYLSVLGLGAAPRRSTPDYATVHQLKHPVGGSLGEVVRSGLSRGWAMRPVIGNRGTGLMMADLAAVVRQSAGARRGRSGE